MVGFTFPDHPLQRAIRREFQVVTPNCYEFGSARQEVVAKGKEGTVTRARECAGLGVNYLDEDVVVDPDCLFLLQALRAL